MELKDKIDEEIETKTLKIIKDTYKREIDSL